MTKQIINIGTADKGNGDPLRTAFTKVNENFTELYTALGLDSGGFNIGAFQFEDNVMSTTDSSNIIIDQQVNITSDLVMSGNIVPLTDGLYDLGSTTKQWRSLHLLGSTIYFSGVPLSITDDGTVFVNNALLGTPGGNLTWDSITNKPVVPDGDKLVNGAHTVSLESTGTLTLPDGLTIANSVIGYASSNTISEETLGGTISATTTVESQIEIDASSVVIAKRIIQVVDDGVVTSTDQTESSLTINNTGASIKKIVEPEGPNNSSYFQVSTTNSGAVIEGVNEDLAGSTYGRVTATQGVVAINSAAGGIDKEWAFDSDGNLTVPSDGTVTGTNDLYIKSLVDGNSSGVFLNGDPLVGTAMLYANGVATIRADSNGTAKDWAFGTEGKLTLPAGTTYEYLSVPLTGHGDGLARLDFTLMTDGVNTNWLAASADPAGSGYSVGDTFTFDEDFLGIPGASVTIEIMSIGEGGSVEDLSFSLSPLYPADIYRDSPINLQVGDEACRWTFGHTGTLTTPGDIQLGIDSYLRFPDSSFQGTAFVGDASRLYGNVDEDVEVTVRHRPAVSAQHWRSGGVNNFVADTSDNDDITVVQEGWTVDIDGTVYTVTATIGGGDEFEIYATGATFVVGTTYTFTNPTATLKTWTFNNETGTLIAPGGAILSSESITEAELTSRDFSIELPTEDGTNEHRWTFDNGIGSLTVPGPIRQGDAKLAFNENGGVNVYLTAVDNDETAVFINTTSVQNYASESVNISAGTNAGLASLENEWLNAEGTWVDAREGDATLVAPTIRAWAGLPSYLAYDIILNSSPDLDPPIPNNFPPVVNAARTAYNNWQLSLNNISIEVAAGDKNWSFLPTGSVTMPGDITQSNQDNTACDPAVDTVIYTSTNGNKHAIKLFVMVEGSQGSSWETQACDIIAVKGFVNDIVHVTAYGVTYSGASPLATFDGQWNAVTDKIEITCQPTGANSVRASVYAIEMNTND